MRSFWHHSQVIFFLLTFILLISLVFAIDAKAEEKEPINISVSSDRVDYEDNGNALFKGNVVIESKRLKLYANTLKVSKKNGQQHFTADGAPLSLSCEDCEGYHVTGQISKQLIFNKEKDEAIFSDNIHLCFEDRCQKGRISAGKGHWNRKTNITHLQGQPTVEGYWQLETGMIEIQAQDLFYNSKSNDITLKGNASIQRDDSNIVGEEIIFNINTGALSAQSPGESRVQATFNNE